MAAEAVPFAKVGGLADVTNALSRALASLGTRVTLVVPAYGSIDRGEHRVRPMPGPETVSIPVGEQRLPLRLETARLPDSEVEVLFVGQDRYFGRAGIYTDPHTGREFADQAERFVFFCRGVVEALRVLGRRPDVLHLNDYHTALVAAYARTTPGADAFFAATAILFGIHNLGYQGLFPASLFPLTGLPAAYMAPLGTLEFWGRMNFMKAGLVLADALCTVSPTYGREIQSGEEYGYGLQGVLQSRSRDLYGILNGIDSGVWNPALDRLIPQRYDCERLQGKETCKRALRARLGLPQTPDTPLFGSISRLAEQKGLDLVLEALPALLASGLQLVVLGSGQEEFETALAEMARQHPRQVAVSLSFDETLAHWIEAGCDFFLMPSRYEPCGLNQMYSLNYGTVPVVRRTGGLADTVSDWEPLSGTGNGFVFEAYRAEALIEAVGRAVSTFRDEAAMRTLQRRGMMADFGWRASARRYLEIYGLALERRGLVAPRSA